jgi:glyoxylase-like metal-dependent hydrolase (beta-lactamase superfamily II)
LTVELSIEAPREIVPGLWRLRTPMTSNALPWIMPYAFAGKDGVSLFDSGYGTPEAQAALEQQLGAIGFAVADVRRLIVSHAHPDHLGLEGWLRERAPQHELVMMGREVDWFTGSHRDHEDWDRRSRTWMRHHGLDVTDAEDSRPDWASQLAHDQAKRARAAEARAASGATGTATDTATETERRAWSMAHVEPDVRLHDGDAVEFDGWRLEAVWTPGHTAGHLCMYESNHRLTLTGDHVLSRITPNVSVSQEDEAAGRNPLREFLDSLAKVSALDTALALPAHEELIEDLPARCAEIALHHEHRCAEVVAAIGSGSVSAAEVAAQVTWNKPYETFSLFKRRSALGETLSHLQLLLDEGRIRRIDDEVVRWERV